MAPEMPSVAKNSAQSRPAVTGHHDSQWAAERWRAGYTADVRPSFHPPTGSLTTPCGAPVYCVQNKDGETDGDGVTCSCFLLYWNTAGSVSAEPLRSWRWMQHICICMRANCFSHVRLFVTLDCSPLGSSVHGSLQARILEWVAMPSSRGSSQPRDRTPVSCDCCIVRQFLYH